MKKRQNRYTYTQTDYLLDLYGLNTVDTISCAIANDDPVAIRDYKAAQLNLLEEMLDCDDRE